MTTLYGIPNCDTIKKARAWLKQHQIDYDFHNYKKMDVPEKELRKWVKKLGWEALLNKRGTTWRKLDDTTKELVNEKSAIQIMLDNPSIIKRPILDMDGEYSVGFNKDHYSSLFN